MEIVSILGFIGAATAGLLFFPQVIKSYRSKKTDEIAWFGVILGVINCIVWISYGLLRGDVFVWGTNVVMMSGALFLGGLKLKYG